jgi:tetratricopeptide (TPR) repeat protein
MNNSNSERLPNLGKTSIAILEHIIEPVLGGKAVEELKRPTKRKEVLQLIQSAFEKAETRFLEECSDKEIRDLVLDLRLSNVASLKQAIVDFYDHPTGNALEETICVQLNADAPTVSRAQIKSSVHLFLSILRQELVLADESVRERLKAEAIVDIQDAVKDIRQVLNQDKDWDNLREEYLKAVLDKYRRVELRGLAPQLLEGPSDLSLSDVYVELQFEEDDLNLPRFKIHESASAPTEQVGDSIGPQDQLSLAGPNEGKRKAEYEPIGQVSSSQKESDSSTANMWDAITRERTVIVGEPGAGKTTAMRYIALVLAGESSIKPAWRFADRLPILARLSKYSNRLKNQPGLHLVDHLCDQPFDKREFGLLLRRELNAGHCLVLLDGLDEVSNIPATINAIEDFIAGNGLNCIIVTSREHAIQHAPLMGFQCVRLKPMDEERIEQFIDQWYSAKFTHQAGKSYSDYQSGSQDLKKVLSTHAKLLELAKNPLMLTIIVLMHWRTTILPARPIEVYQAATDTLIQYWPSWQERQGIESLDLPRIRQILMPIAYNMLPGNGLIGEEDLLRQLIEEIGHVYGWDDIRAREAGRRLLEAICGQSGILTEQGIDFLSGERVFGFLHQRFTEYLAACYLTDRWDVGDPGFVLKHVHDPRWVEVIVLFIARFDNTPRATKALEAILNLNSSWEKVVWRDHLLTGRCLGEALLVTPDLQHRILQQLATLLIDLDPHLRAKALNAFTGLRGTQYQQPAVEHIAELLKNDWPWYISIDIATALLRLGERTHCYELLCYLRESAKQRGERSSTAHAVELLLEGWKEETTDWLIDVAKQYTGRGLELGIDADPFATVVVATDQSFGEVSIGRYLRTELKQFANRLIYILGDKDQQERAKWIASRLANSADQIRELAVNGHDERVRRLAAEWLVKQGDRETGMQVLKEITIQGDGNLTALNTFLQLSEYGDALTGVRTTLSKTLSATDELRAAKLLVDLSLKDEAAVILVELLVSDDLAEAGTYFAAEQLLNTSARQVGLSRLKVIAASVQHLYRYEAAVAMADAGIVDLAYQALLNITECSGTFDRINAVTKLSGNVFRAKLKEMGRDLRSIAAHVVSEVSNKYESVSHLLEAGIAVDEAEVTYSDVLSFTHEEWTRLSHDLLDEFRAESKAWLGTVTTQEWTYPYAHAAKAYLLEADHVIDDAISVFREAVSHHEASTRLLLRVGSRLLKLKAREEGLVALMRVPTHSDSEIDCWLQVILELILNNETDLGLKVVREKVIPNATDFQTRRAAAWFLTQLGQADEGRNLLFDDKDELLISSDIDVPSRVDWLQGSDTHKFRDTVIKLSTHLIKLFPDFVHAYVLKAETLRQLEDLNAALEAIDKAIQIDNKYALAWAVKGQILENKGKRTAALDALDRAITLNPRYTWAWTIKAQVLRTLGRYETAHSSIRQALVTDDRFISVWGIKGSVLRDMGKFEEAMRILEVAVDLNPDYSWAYAVRADTLYRLGRFDEALEEIEKSLKIDGSYRFAWLIRAKIFDDSGRYAEAYRLFAEALESADKTIQLNAVISLGELSHPNAITLLSKALIDAEPEVCRSAAEALGEWTQTEAEEALISALKHPSNLVRRVTAIALADSSNPEAINALLNTFENDEDNSVRAEAAQAVGTIANESVLREIYTLVRDGEEAVAERAAYGLAVARNTEISLGLLREAISKRPQMAMLHSLLGVLLRRMGRYEEALVAQDEAISQDRERAIFFALRSATHHAKGDYENAITDLRHAIDLYPSAELLWAALGEALFEAHRDGEALQAWWRAMSEGAGISLVMADLGIGLWATGNKMKALGFWQRACIRNPKLGQDWEWMERDITWGPRQIAVTHEIMATLKIEAANN